MIRIDGDGERRPHRLGVLALHLLETQLVAPLVRQGETHPAASVGDHEIDHLGGDQLCRADQVALVLPVLVIGDDDEFAVPEVFDGLLDGAEGHGVSC